jgi:hypothetical protein
MRSQLTGVKAVAPVAQKSVTVVYGTESRTTIVTGTTNDYFVTQDWALKAGRQFLEGEMRGGRSACIIGETVRDELFGRADPIGAQYSCRQDSCEVIGLLEPKGQSSFGTDQDDIVIMPIRPSTGVSRGNTDISRGSWSPPRTASRRPRCRRYRTAAARTPQHRLRRGGRLFRPRHEADRADDGRHHRDADGTAGRRGRGQPARRWHRHHEHHACLGHRAHARDRHPAGHRSAGAPGLSQFLVEAVCCRCSAVWSEFCSGSGSPCLRHAASRCPLSWTL